MNDERQSTQTNSYGSLIGDQGFTAMLREEDPERSFAGILGTPRITPTRSGLSIEDFDGAVLDGLMRALLEGMAARVLRVESDRVAAPVERQGLERIKRRGRRTELGSIDRDATANDDMLVRS